MLRETLAIFRRAPGATLTREAIAAELGVPPALLDHALRALVATGRLAIVEECDGCGPCPLARVCPGGLDVGRRGYALAGPQV